MGSFILYTRYSSVERKKNQLPRENGFMFNVVKRDGEIAEFTVQKISDAISKAFNATEKLYNEDIINLLALRVTSDFQSKVKDGVLVWRIFKIRLNMCWNKQDIQMLRKHISYIVKIERRFVI